MRIIATLITIALATPASAQNVIPPPEYDHAFTGKLILHKNKSPSEIKALCKGVVFPVYALGCSLRFTSEFCIIMIATEDAIRAAGATPEVVLRHEHGHCNGWPKNHPNARPLR